MLQTPAEPPAYRHSRLGRVIVAALILQWAGMWYRSAVHFDNVIWNTPFGDDSGQGRFGIGASSGWQRAGIAVWKWTNRPIGLAYRHYPLSQLGEFRENLDSKETTWLADNRLICAGFDPQRLFLYVPYWFLIIFTLVAYFAIGRIRRRRFNRRVKRK